MVIKFAGVHPQGLKNLHDTQDRVNDAWPFSQSTKTQKIQILRSEYSGNHGAYVIEIRIPFVTTNPEKHGGDPQPVPYSVIGEFYAAIGAFPTLERKTT